MKTAQISNACKSLHFRQGNIIHQCKFCSDYTHFSKLKFAVFISPNYTHTHRSLSEHSVNIT